MLRILANAAIGEKTGGKIQILIKILERRDAQRFLNYHLTDEARMNETFITCMRVRNK